MQSRLTFPLILASFLAAAAFSSGCIIVADNGTGGAGGSGASGGAGGTGGTGGQGGQGGTGGEGGAGVGGSGGGSSCVMPKDGTLTADACNMMNITPAPKGSATQCQGTDDQGNPITFDPPGYSVCLRGFDIYQAGAADVLQKCLSNISVAPAFACDVALVGDCVGEMYKAACPSTDAADTCDAIAKQLCVNGETFKSQDCMVDTNPFNATALQDLADCITNSAQPDCNLAYDECFATITSY